MHFDDEIVDIFKTCLEYRSCLKKKKNYECRLIYFKTYICFYKIKKFVERIGIYFLTINVAKKFTNRYPMDMIYARLVYIFHEFYKMIEICGRFESLELAPK